MVFSQNIIFPCIYINIVKDQTLSAIFFFRTNKLLSTFFSQSISFQAYYECLVFCCDLFAKLQLQVHHHINAYGCFNIQLAFHTSCSSSARKTCECTINCFMKWSLFSYLQKLHWSILLFDRWVKKILAWKTKGIFCFCILSKFICFWCTENVCALSIAYAQNFRLHVHVYLPVFVKIENKEIACIYTFNSMVNFLHNLEFIYPTFLFTNDYLQTKE